MQRRPLVHPLAVAMASLVIGSAVACQAAAALTLTNRAFLSSAVTDNGAAFSLVPGTRVRLGFSDGGITASAGCNTLGATYRIDGGTLLIDGGAMTDMGCDAARNTQDQWLFAFLGSKPSVALVGSDLTLDNGSTIMRLVDRTIVEPDLDLVGPTWTVTTLIDGDAASSVPAGATATLVFRDDGRIDVDDGCNHGSGRWSLEGSGVRIADLATTKMACEGPGGALEAAVLAVLDRGSLQASITASVLSLSAGGKGLQLQGS